MRTLRASSAKLVVRDFAPAPAFPLSLFAASLLHRNSLHLATRISQLTLLSKQLTVAKMSTQFEPPVDMPGK